MAVTDISHYFDTACFEKNRDRAEDRGRTKDDSEPSTNSLYFSYEYLSCGIAISSIDRWATCVNGAWVYYTQAALCRFVDTKTFMHSSRRLRMCSDKHDMNV